MSDEKVLGILYRAQGASQVVASTKQVQGALSGLTGHANQFASSLKTNVGNALNHFGGRLKQIGVGLAAGLGVGGLLGAGSAIDQALSKAQTWGAAIEKLGPITGDTAEQLSGLLAVAEKYNIQADQLVRVAGFESKAVGALAVNAKAGAKFQKEYGFSIVDSQGKVKDFTSMLLTFSDYYKSNTNEAQKNAAAAKLFGRGYTDLIPILALGSKGIADAIAEAKALGLTLTQDNVTALKEARDATRKWSDAIGGLELQVGLALLPSLAALATAATKFVSDHRTDIVAFFKNAAAAAQTIAGDIGNLAGAVNAFWNSIPAGVRSLLVTGFVADRAISFFFGISPIKIVASLATSAISGLLGGVGKALGSSLAAAGLGKLFVQPVFVTNPGFGASGAAGAAEGAGGEVAAGATGAGGAEAVAGFLAPGLATAVGGALATVLPYWLIQYFSDHKPGTPLNLPGGQVNPNTTLGKDILMGNPNIGNIAANNGLIKPSSGPLPVIDMSPTARDERHQALMADAAISARQQVTNAKIAQSNALLHQIAAKRAENKINVSLRANSSTFVKVGVGSITQAQTTVRVYGTGGATGKYLS